MIRGAFGFHAPLCAYALAPITREVSLTRFRGSLTRSKFGAEVAHEIEGECRVSRAA